MKFLEKFTSIYVVSPHLDDAAFSTGGLISSAHESGRSFTVLNVFTQPGDSRNTISSKALISQCNFSSAHSMFSARRQEDAKSFSLLPSVKIIDMGHVDALWRRRPGPILPLCELSSLYPTYRWHVTSGKIHQQDQLLISQIAAKIRHLAAGSRTLLIAPLGIGKHVDHLVANQACLDSDLPCIFYADFPYHLSSPPDIQFIKRHQLEKLSFSSNLDQKHQLIMGYRSQIIPVFGQANPPTINDIYYIPQQMLKP